MERHQGVPEPYIILDEIVGDAIYDPPNVAGDQAKDRAPQNSPPPNGDGQNERPGSK